MTTNQKEELDMENYPKEFPAESQNRQPGIESEMNPAPVYEYKEYKGADKLKGKTALITGATAVSDAVAVAYAKEGANVAIVYFDEHDDAEDTKTSGRRRRKMSVNPRRCR